MKKHGHQLALILAFCVISTACATQTTNKPPTPTPTPTLSSIIITDTPTPEGPYPTPTAWQTFTYPITDIFTLAYPIGWTYAPPMLNSIDMGSTTDDSGLTRERMTVSLAAYFGPSEIANLCPHQPTTTLAGLPARQIMEHDEIGQPYYGWDAANSAIGLRMTFTIAIGAGHLDDYQAIYTYMVNSVSVAPRYRNAPPCTPG